MALQKKVITDKNGKRTTVYVKTNKDDPKTKYKNASKVVKNAEYNKWLKTSKKLNDMVDKFSDALQKFPKSESGGVTDEARATMKFKIANNQYKQGFKMLQDFNKKSPKEFMRKKAEEKRASWRKN